MPELIAKGQNPSESWRRTLVEGTSMRLGRAPTLGMSVSWDNRISREHVEIVWRDRRLHVRCLESARNPVFYQGEASREFAVEVGEHFVIGSTSFHVAEEQALVSLSPPEPREEHAFRPGDLRRIQFSNADHRLEVLSHLPELIADSTSDEMFSARLVGLLLAGVSSAEAAALVRRVEPQLDDDRQVQVLQWNRRRDAAGRFQASQCPCR